MIHHPKQPGDGYSISSNQAWRPGVFDSERTARYAFHFYDEDLTALQQSVNPGGTITFAMLQALRRKVGKSKPWERKP